MGTKRKSFKGKKNEISLAVARQVKRQKKNQKVDEANAASNHDDTQQDEFASLVEDLQNMSTQKTNDEADSIEDFEINVEPNISSSPAFQIEGRRIVDISQFFDQLKTLSAHNPGFECTINNLVIIKEKLIGLQSIIYFECNMCNQKLQIHCLANSSYDSDSMTINHAAVTGAILIGCGQSNLNELLTAMDLPNLNNKTYKKCHSDVSDWWAVAAEKSVKEAAKDESDLAIENGDVVDGIPAITVVADACWSKRSYGKNFAAASGAAAIIGFKTGKVLFLAVKNKYCVVCTRSALKKQPTPVHQCTRNHEGSSTSMEQSSIVEGFKSSVKTHNLIYKTLVADGDASTYKKILESRPYPNIQVEKIECTNHLLRNYTSKLMQLQKDTSIPLFERKLLTMERITRLRTAVRAAIRFRNAQNLSNSDKIIKLKDDILNSPNHIFGNHGACEEYYCNDEKKKETNLVSSVKTLFGKLMPYTIQISLHSKSLLYNVTNNRAEQFNSIIAKHVGGKRINFSLKNSYKTRCHAAVVAFNNIGKAQYNLYKSNFGKSPRRSIKRLELGLCKRKANRKRRPISRKKIVFQNGGNDYGEKCQKPDLTQDQYETSKTLFLQNLKGLVEKRHEIERDTVLQAESALWLELRRCLLTASSFSKVCKRRCNISSAPLVKSLLYSYCLSNVAAIKHGKENEKIAVRQLEQQEGINLFHATHFFRKRLSHATSLKHSEIIVM